MNKQDSMPVNDRVNKAGSQLEEDFLYLSMLLKSYYELNELTDQATPPWLFVLSQPVSSLEKSIYGYIEAVSELRRPTLQAPE